MTAIIWYKLYRHAPWRPVIDELTKRPKLYKNRLTARDAAFNYKRRDSRFNFRVEVRR